MANTATTLITLETPFPEEPKDQIRINPKNPMAPTERVREVRAVRARIGVAQVRVRVIAVQAVDRTAARTTDQVAVLVMGHQAVKIDPVPQLCYQ